MRGRENERWKEQGGEEYNDWVLSACADPRTFVFVVVNGL
jgi:hypothetical protein